MGGCSSWAVMHRIVGGSALNRRCHLISMPSVREEATQIDKPWRVSAKHRHGIHDLHHEYTTRYISTWEEPRRRYCGRWLSQPLLATPPWMPMLLKAAIRLTLLSTLGSRSLPPLGITLLPWMQIGTPTSCPHLEGGDVGGCRYWRKGTLPNWI